MKINKLLVTGAGFFFINLNLLFAANNNYINFSQRDPFSQSSIKVFKKDINHISLQSYMSIINQNPNLIKELLLKKVGIEKVINVTSYKPFSHKEIVKEIDRLKNNELFQKAFFYLFIDKNFYIFNSRKVPLPNFQKGFKYLSEVILDTNNPIASFIGTYLLFMNFNTANNSVWEKYGELFAEPLYRTKKSCLGDYMYGDYFLNKTNKQNFDLAHNILYTGYEKCKKLEKEKGLPHVVAWQMRVASAKAKALSIIHKGKK